MDESNREVGVAVVGAGLAGLAAAAIVARAGGSVTVFDKGKAPGGRAATKRERGYALNQGPHALYRKSAGMGVLRNLGIEPRGGVPAIGGSYAFDRDELHTLPGGLASLLTTGLLGLAGKLELARILARLPRLDAVALDGVTVDRWVTDAARDPAVRRMLLALVRVSTYAAETDRLSAGVAIRQLRSALEGGVLYLDGGWQTLVDALAGALRAAGGRIEPGTRAVAIERDDARFRVRFAGGHVVSARSVIVALPLADAAELVGSERLRGHAHGARPVRAACLDLALSSVPRPKAKFALGLDRPLYFSLHSASAALAPAGGGLLHAARYLGSGDDGTGAAAELEALVDRLQPGWREHVAERRFLPHMLVASDLPTAEQGGLAGRPVVALDSPGLFLAGDWVGADGLLADASLASAAAAAERAIDRGALREARPAA
jgi:phytoene dehydrogenase-like protein